MKTVFMTGATGLAGAEIARQLMEKGYAVRGVIRNPESKDAKALAATGVEVVKGDVSDLASVVAGMEGADAVIHSAAMLGGPDQSIAEGFSTNVMGTMNVLTAAARLGVSPVVQLLTTTYFDMWETSLTETSPLDVKATNVDPYSVTKRLAFLEAQGRIAAGQDIRFVIPGGIYGPSPCVDRALTLPSMNVTVAAALKGEMDEIIAMPIPWVYVADVAYVTVAALEKGRAGERYIALGRPEDVGSIAYFCNTAAELEGIAHRVKEVPKERLDDPALREKYGDSWVDLGKSSFPTPWFENSFTKERLGYVPTPLKEGLKPTIAWLKAEGLA